MCLELLHVLGVWELVALNAPGRFLFVFCPAEEDSACGGETYLRTVVLHELALVVILVLVELYLAEYPFAACAD
jgi:hypothetical protein